MIAATCLALAVYYEARNQSPDAQLAVAEVVINRVDDPRWPDNICDVVYEDKGPRAWDCQFSFTCDGKPENPRHKEAWSMARAIADKAMRGDVLGHGAKWYLASGVSTKWAKRLDIVGNIGDHVFYTDKE